MKRSGFKPRAEPMARGTTPMKRGKRMGPGKKTKARKDAIEAAKVNYMDYFGDLDHETHEAFCPCQYCGKDIRGEWMTAHHKTPRSELRKQGVKDLDAAHRLLMVHAKCHRKIHGHGKDGFGMGRPTDEREADEFRAVETSPANAENGQIIQRLP